jgi:hypothetical protein
MADEPLAAGAMMLEDHAEVVGPVGAAPAAVETVTDAEDAVPEGTIEGSGGVRFVPLAAVIAERTGRKEATKQLATKDAEIATLKGKAEEWDRVAPAVQAAMPLIERIKGRPDILALLDKPAEAAAPAKTLSDADAIEYAKDLDLFKADGTPDVDRAQRLAARQEAIAAKQTQAAMAPIHATDAQRASAGLKQQLLAVKDAEGHSIDPKALDSIWSIVPPELSAKPEVAQILYLAAKGMAAHAGKGAKPGPGPVLQTESLGGGKVPDGDKPSRFATAAGIGQAEFRKTTSAFKPNAVNVLE